MEITRHETSCECNCQIGYVEYRRFMQETKFKPLHDSERFECETSANVHLFNFCPSCGQELEVEMKNDGAMIYFERVTK